MATGGDIKSIEATTYQFWPLSNKSDTEVDKPICLANVIYFHFKCAILMTPMELNIIKLHAFCRYYCLSTIWKLNLRQERLIFKSPGKWCKLPTYKIIFGKAGFPWSIRQRWYLRCEKLNLMERFQKLFQQTNCTLVIYRRIVSISQNIHEDGNCTTHHARNAYAYWLRNNIQFHISEFSIFAVGGPGSVIKGNISVASMVQFQG